jgi:IS1 family transposase
MSKENVKKYGFGSRGYVETREIVGLALGDRSEKTAQKLWESLPKVYRQCAVCYTDFWSAYQEVLPSKRHKAVNKSSGKTSYIERFNNTLRQRVSRPEKLDLSLKKSKIISAFSGILYITIASLNHS